MAPAQAKNPMAWDELWNKFNGKSKIPDSIENGMIQIPIAYLSKELLLGIVKDLLKFCSLDEDLKESSAVSSVENDETTSFKVQSKGLATSDPEPWDINGSEMDAKSQKFEISRKKSRKTSLLGKKLKNCSFCNQAHIWGKTLCSSFGKRCSYCNVLNHCEDACYWKHPELLENNHRHFVKRNLKGNMRDKMKEANVADRATEISSTRNSEKAIELSEKSDMRMKCREKCNQTSARDPKDPSPKRSEPTGVCEESGIKITCFEGSARRVKKFQYSDEKMEYDGEYFEVDSKDLKNWFLNEMEMPKDKRWFENKRIHSTAVELGGIVFKKFTEKLQELKTERKRIIENKII